MTPLGLHFHDIHWQAPKSQVETFWFRYSIQHSSHFYIYFYKYIMFIHYYACDKVISRSDLLILHPVTNKESALKWAIHKHLLKKDTLLNK